MNGGPPKTFTCYDKGTSRIEHVEEGYFDITDSIVENDEAIAHSLQEEVTRLEIVEASESRRAEDQDQQASILAQDWLGSSRKRFDSNGKSNQEETHGEGTVPNNLWKLFASLIEYVEESDCNSIETIMEKDDQQASILAQDWLGSSRKHFDSDDKFNQEEGHGKRMVFNNPGELLAEDKEWEVLPKIADELILDSELRARLNEMVPVPHVPKINGEIPSAVDAMSDHERLIARLELYDLVEVKVSGDGNCQFRSLSDQIYRTPKHHKYVREQIVNQLKSHRELYENYVPMAYDDYLKKMSKIGEWGDHVTLQAAADAYGVEIFMITSFKDTCYIEILPQTPMPNRMIFLSFRAEVHYNSIYPQEEFPAVENKKKKWKL